MGLLETIRSSIASRAGEISTSYIVLLSVGTFIAASILLNVFSQIFLKDKTAPPVVFHWVPFIGSTISYGMDPYSFFFESKEKYGDIFTFILLGKKTTVFLGTKGNDFILNGKHSDLNAEEIYRPLTAPVFGKDVVYDCPNAKLMEQKKFVKFGLTTEAFREYVSLIEKETNNFMTTNIHFGNGSSGTLDVPPAMGELTLYTASRALQGKEVRDKFNAEFSNLFHDLDAGFQPINFMMPWAPLPQNRKRDAANRKMAQTYLDIVQDRRAGGSKKDSEDMIWNLMQCKYKNGQQIPDGEICNMMIALLMAGQHSSATTASFILLRLAANPTIIEELLEEQRRVLGDDLPALSYEDLSKLTLHNQVVKETLRWHAPIHSVMRKVTNPMPIEGTSWTVPTSHTLLAAPGVTSRQSQYFPMPEVWDPHRWDVGVKSATTPTLPSNTDAGGDAEDDKVDYGYGLVSKGTASPYLPFGAGRHRCIGEQFAYLQLTTILATMVRELKWRTPAGMEGKTPATDYSSLFSRPMRPAKILWERRRAVVETEKSK